jgi:hypothetical protein
MIGSDAPPPPPASATEIPYEEVTELTFSHTVVANFSMTRTADGIELDGPCPRCRHVMHWLVLDDERLGYRTVVTGGIGQHTAPSTSRSTGASENMGRVDEDESMICTCTVEHPHHPTGRTGCGAGWNVQLR